jgi:hypothetical protein
MGVPGPQGTDSGPRAHPGSGCKPAGGANILSSRSLSESLYFGIPKRLCSMADTWRPMSRADVTMFSVKPSHAVVPRGPLLLSGSRGARGNHDHDARTDRTPCIWDARGFCFSASAPSFRRPVPTDERDLGPLVSAWVCGACGVGTKRSARWAAACRGGQTGDGTERTDPYSQSPVFCTHLLCLLHFLVPSQPSAIVHCHGR